MQEDTFSPAFNVVALGVYVPSHIFIRCILYHCLIPSSLATSPIALPSTLPISPPIELRVLWETLLKIDPRDGELVMEPDAVERTLWPSVDVLSYGFRCQQMNIGWDEVKYCNNMVVFHKSWFVTG